jgi:ubiquitin-protein ligase
MCDLFKINSNLETLTKEEILDIGELPKSEAFALKDIFKNRCFIYGPKEDRFHPGKYALGIQIKNYEGKVNA